MGRHVLGRVADLGDDLVLAPERYDPRRKAELVARRCLADYADVLTENVAARAFAATDEVLILDTTHAYEGFAVLRHEPVLRDGIGSTKRALQPGDVVVSRLRPYLRQVAYIDDALFRMSPRGNAVLASTEFFVLRGRNDFPAAALVPFLLSDPVQTALAAGQEGGHHPRFNKDLLRSLPVPECVVADARRTARQIVRLAGNVRDALLASRKLVADVNERILA